jgi:hypothetical protein
VLDQAIDTSNCTGRLMEKRRRPKPTPSSLFAEEGWQLGDVARYATCLILGRHLDSRANRRERLAIMASQTLKPPEMISTDQGGGNLRSLIL